MTKETAERPPDTRKHTVLPVSIRLKSTEKTPACVSMWAFLQPISTRIYFGKTASHRKRARLVQSRGASPQAYWMSVKAAQRRGCAKRAFCGVCFLMSGGLRPGVAVCRKVLSFRASDRVTGVGIRVQKGTDCRVAALLAMTDFVRADDSVRPVKALHPVGRDPCVPPPVPVIPSQ